MRALFYRYLFFTFLAAIAYLCMFVFGFLTDGIPTDFLSRSTALSDIAKIVGGIALGGAVFMLNTYLRTTPPDELSKENIANATGLMRIAFRGVAAYAQIVIGGCGIAAALAEIINALRFHAEMGFWHTESFCEAVGAGRLCPIQTPVFSWIFNAPAFLIFVIGGLQLVYRGREVLRPQTADNSIS